MKSVSGNLKLSLSQFRELASFAQFGSDLDESTKSQIDRGQRLTELLKQTQYSPASVWEQYSSIYAVSGGYFDKVPVSQIKQAQHALLQDIKQNHKKLIDQLESGDKPAEDATETIKKVAHKIAKTFEEI